MKLKKITDDQKLVDPQIENAIKKMLKKIGRDKEKYDVVGNKIYLKGPVQEIRVGYCTYDSVVVIAENEKEAIKIHPNGNEVIAKYNKWFNIGFPEDIGSYNPGDLDEWIEYKDINKIKVTLIGVANDNQKKGVLLSSYNAG